MRRLVLIDGNALLHRAYHAVPPLTTTEGELVNAVFGFTSMLLRVLAELKPECVAVCFDRKAPTFRHKEFAEYKAGRPEMDLGLAGQIKRTEEVVEAFNIPIFAKDGYEADDLIATLTKQAVGDIKILGYKDIKSKKGKSHNIAISQYRNIDVIIVTGDRDALRLVSEKVKVYMPRKTLADTVLYDRQKVKEKYGLEPEELTDFKALAGDQSDNVPGVGGIGEVTATKLISQFKTLENLYQHLDAIPEKIRQKLINDKEKAFLSKKLVSLDFDAPIELNLEKCVLLDYDRERVTELFGKLQFRSLIGRLPSSAPMKSELRKGEPGGPIRQIRRIGPIRQIGQEKLTSEELDEQLEPILEKMSKTGVLVDKQVLQELERDLNKRITEIEQEIYSVVGHEFNINSPKQLAPILFEELGLPVGRKIKTGRSTDEMTLRALVGVHPIVGLILEYRELFKLKSTYVEALPKSVASDGRIHSQFHLDVTATGRLSSSNPNLQNIPIKGEWGTRIRKAFIAPKGRVLLSADYSQIELRVMAHLSGDLGLQEAFINGEDIHTATAASIFNVPISAVTKDQRRAAKTVNFGLMYGMSAFGLAAELGCDHSTAANFIQEYFEHFPKVRVWIEETLNEARETGFVQTLLGRRRYVPELSATNGRIRAAGERMAINMPVQGTAADIIKKAMVEIDGELRMDNGQWTMDKKTNSQLSIFNCQLILQIHDELLFECDGSADSLQVKEAAKMIKDKMENAFHLSVPIIVEVKVGPNWAEMENIN